MNGNPPTDLASILLLPTFRNSTAEGIPPSDINGADAARRVFERNQWMEYRNFPAEVVFVTSVTSVDPSCVRFWVSASSGMWMWTSDVVVVVVGDKPPCGGVRRRPSERRGEKRAGNMPVTHGEGKAPQPRFVPRPTDQPTDRDRFSHFRVTSNELAECRP